MPPATLLRFSCCLALALACASSWPAGAPSAQPHTFAPIVKGQRAKVVHIDTTAQGGSRGARDAESFRFPERDQGSGSGFIISADGYIVTNYHVVERADRIEVVLADERRFAAEVVGLDAQTDLALIKIDAVDLPVVAFGDSKQLEVGDWVIAIGNPLGLDHTVTAGIISAKGRNIFNDENLAYGEFLQTDAAINPGNSGGPLFNLAGQVVGVNAAISRRGQGIGFAVPSNLVVQVIDQLREYGRVNRGWLGVVIVEVTRELVAQLVLPEGTRGVMIDETLPDSPAKADGLRPGDVLVQFGMERLSKVAQLQKLVALSAPGSAVDVRALRREDDAAPWQTLHVRVRIGVNPSSAAAGPSPLVRLGISALNIPDDLRRRVQLKPRQGVLVEAVTEGGPAQAAGLRAGDIILEVDRLPVGSRVLLESALLDPPNERISLLVQRGKTVLFLSIERGALGG